MQPSRPDTFRAWFPAIVYEAGPFRVVAKLNENKTVPDTVRFDVEGRSVDAMGQACWQATMVSHRRRVELLEEALAAFVCSAAESATADDARELEQVTR